MKANELRIGSYYNYDGDSIKLDGSTLASYLQNDTDFNLEPILLNEKEILKFGFKKVIISTSIKGLNVTYYKKGNFIVYLLGDFFEIELINKSGDQFNLFKTFKKEVHKLQNIYFELTGKELTYD